MPKKRKKKRSSKGVLIKGMTKPLSIELLKEPYFGKTLDEIMRGYAGVYALYRKDRIYYIGLASNLYWRIHAHTKNRHKGKWDSFAIFRINRVRYLKDIETLLLRVASPPGNAVSGHLSKNADLTKILRRIPSEQMRRLKKIEKALR